MGATQTDEVITIQFYKKDGQPDEQPIYGRYCQLYGKLRDDVIATTMGSTPDEAAHGGSDDWLTLVAVADSEEKLAAILTDSGDIDPCNPKPSLSSHRLAVKVDVGSVTRSMKGCTTIAS